MKDPIAVLSREGRIVEMNSAFIDLSGQKRDSLIGQDCWKVDILAPLWDNTTACLLHRKEQEERVTLGDRIFDVTMTPVIAGGEASNVCICFKDITTFVSLEGQFIKRNKELVIANTLAGAFISSSNLETIYDELVESVLLVCGLGAGWIVLKKHDDFELKTNHGISNGFREKLESDTFFHLYQSVLDSHEPFFIAESGAEEMPAQLKEEGTVFFSAIPLRAGTDVLGLLLMVSRTEVDFEFDSASLFSLIGNTLSLIAEKIILFQRTQELAITDPLTGLFNARHFYQTLDAEVNRTERYSMPFSIVLYDIDNFKRLNDTHGHQAGDEVLRTISTEMKMSLRKTDILSRYGGEEFIAILPNTGKEEAIHMAERLKEAAEREMVIDGDKVAVTVSGGVATFPADGETSKALLYSADMAMYQAKEAGKNQIKCYTKGK
jgi:diguanylate cyclase (GGDEF)-like protein/PAS domain S-box-containing protein